MGVEIDPITNGAQGETRTLTSIAHSDLNTACLPISPPGLEARHVTTSHITLTVLFLLGTRGRTRTGTPAKAGDFESPASTNFATLANHHRSVAAYITAKRKSVNSFFLMISLT